MNLNFILDENYLALFILAREMHCESSIVKEIKESLKNDIGYKKILSQEILDSNIYINDEETRKLINELEDTNKFKEIYQKYNNESKDTIAIKLLKDYIKDDSKELDDIKEDLWNKYIDSYQKIFKVGFYNPSHYLLDNDVLNTIDKLKNNNEFNRLYAEAKTYKNALKKIWLDNKEYINNYLTNVLKINININPNVYVTHPNANRGYSFDNNIVWGHFKGITDSNYNLTYLVHETLHILLPYKKEENEDESNIKHSIIELISDYELQSKLTGKSTFNDGHSYLDKYKKELYPTFLNYLGLNNEEIQERIKKDNVDISNYNNDDLSKLNIYEFTEYCCNLYKKQSVLSK